MQKNYGGSRGRRLVELQKKLTQVINIIGSTDSLMTAMFLVFIHRKIQHILGFFDAGFLIWMFGSLVDTKMPWWFQTGCYQHFIQISEK
jgi:hypothetical protein